MILVASTLLILSGCKDRNKDKVDALISVVNSCNVGGTVSLKVHVGTWGSYTETTCTWVKKEEDI